MAPSPCIFIPSFLRAKIRTGQFRQKRNSKLVMLAALLFPGDRLEKHGHKLLLKTETGAYLQSQFKTTHIMCGIITIICT